MAHVKTFSRNRDTGRITERFNLDMVIEGDLEVLGTLISHVEEFTLTKEDVGLGNVDNTADVNKPVSSAQQEAINNAVAAATNQQPEISALVSGGIVVWESAYTFRVSAATYFIQGVLYSASEKTVTLDVADGSNDRIDVLVLNTAGDLVKITGTAAAQPSEPDYDPTTQLKLTFVFVGASTTEPANVSNENVYLENSEWTSSTSGSGWNANSSSNPHAGTKTIEGTNVANNAYVQLQRGSSLALDSYATLSFFIRSKATFGNNRVLRVQFFLDGVAKGAALTIASGYWGFDSSQTSSYQLIAIPISQFVLPAGQLINQLRITDVGGAIGCYIDDIVLQLTATDLSVPPTGLSQSQADALYTKRANNLSDLSSASTARTNLGAVPGSNNFGYLNIPQNSQSAAYTTVLADRGKHILHPSTDANARTFTIDSNANVAYPTGTAITFINMTSQVVTIAITSDTMYLAGTGTTGSRSLAQYGVATAIKIDSTHWVISGTGLT